MLLRESLCIAELKRLTIQNDFMLDSIRRLRSVACVSSVEEPMSYNCKGRVLRGVVREAEKTGEPAGKVAETKGNSCHRPQCVALD